MSPGLAARAGSAPASVWDSPITQLRMAGGGSQHSFCCVAGKPESQVLSNGKHLPSAEFVNKERRKEN